MRAGLGVFVFGVALLGIGIAVTVLSEQVVAYGAIGVGLYYAIKGVVVMARQSR